MTMMMWWCDGNKWWLIVGDDEWMLQPAHSIWWENSQFIVFVLFCFFREKTQAREVKRDGGRSRRREHKQYHHFWIIVFQFFFGIFMSEPLLLLLCYRRFGVSLMCWMSLWVTCLWASVVTCSVQVYSMSEVWTKRLLGVGIELAAWKFSACIYKESDLTTQAQAQTTRAQVQALARAGLHQLLSNVSHARMLGFLGQSMKRWTIYIYLECLWKVDVGLLGCHYYQHSPQRDSERYIHSRCLPLLTTLSHTHTSHIVTSSSLTTEGGVSL